MGTQIPASLQKALKDKVVKTTDGNTYRCVVCNSTATGNIPADAHLRGGMHREAGAKYAIQHIIDAKSSLTDFLSKKTKEAAKKGVIKVKNNNIKCIPCSKELSGIAPLEQHLNSDSHKRQMDLQNRQAVPQISNKPAPIQHKASASAYSVPQTERALASGIKRPKGNQQDTLSSPQTNTPVRRAINSTPSRTNIQPPLPPNFEYDGRNMGRSRTDQVSYREVTGSQVPVNVPRDELQRNHRQASAMATNPVLSNEAGFSDSPLERGLTTSMIISNGNQQYTCLACETTLSGEGNVPLHLNGTRHRREVERQRRTGSTMRLRDESMRGMSDDTYGAIGGPEGTRDSQARSSSDVPRLSALFHNLNLSPPHRNMSMRQPSTNSAAAYENMPADFRSWQRDARNLGRLPSNELLPPAMFTKPTHLSSEESSH